MVFMALKRRSIQQLAYSMAMPEPQESAENQYLGNRLLFKLENPRSFNYQNYMKKNNYETNASSRAIKYMSGTIAETEKCKILHIMKFELDLYVMFLTTFPLLFGSDTYTDHTNSKFLEKVRCFIKQTKRFCTPSQQL